ILTALFEQAVTTPCPRYACPIVKIVPTGIYTYLLIKKRNWGSTNRFTLPQLRIITLFCSALLVGYPLLAVFIMAHR
ncbi:MAG: hypothetical protein J6F33_14475, partial [Acidaminococcaceae bacterium]|nr:hypothetical protein [Acidaminococcaceae bacterium]